MSGEIAHYGIDWSDGPDMTAINCGSGYLIEEEPVNMAWALYRDGIRLATVAHREVVQYATAGDRIEVALAKALWARYKLNAKALPLSSANEVRG